MTNAGGIQRPVVPPRAGAQLSEAMVQSVNPSAVLRRWGIVTAVNASSGTVNVDVAGTNVAAVRRHSDYDPVVGERVVVDVVGTDMTVVGATAPRVGITRVAQVTAIAGDLVTIRWDDTGLTQTGVTRLSGTAHSVNDIVKVQTYGSGSSTTYSVVSLISSASAPIEYEQRPTGTIEATLRKTPRAGTLLLQGQSISRSVYKRLFDWAVAQGLFSETAGANVFGPGNTAGEFKIPDLQGRVLSGADATNPLGKAFGSITQSTTLTAAHIPAISHNHTIPNLRHRAHTHGISDSGHSHAITDSSSGHAHGADHGRHFNGSRYDAMAGPDYGLAAWNSSGSTVGVGTSIERVAQHLRMSVERAGTNMDLSTEMGIAEHDHVVGIQAATTGSATPTPVSANVQQPSYSVNYFIWI